MALLGRNSQHMLMDRRISSEVPGTKCVSTVKLLTRCELCIGEIAFLYYKLAGCKLVLGRHCDLTMLL